MIRVVLPAHLRNIAKVSGEVEVEVVGTPSPASVIDALETRFPDLLGTIRDPAKNEPYIAIRRSREHDRFFKIETRMEPGLWQRTEEEAGAPR